MRFLLLFHLLVIALSVVALWPTLPMSRADLSGLSLGRDLGFVALALVIGVSSARLGAGLALRPMDWVVHVLWNLLFLTSYFFRWGPFQFRLQASPGSMEEFSLLNKLHPLLLLLPAVLLVGVYSAIPIGLSLLAGGRLRRTESGQARLPRILSMVSFGAAVVASLLLRYVWHGSEEVAGLVVGVLLVVSFGIAGFFAARGDNASTRILLCEAGLFGLLRFV
jgi:hypothetical protein